jgi:hypothetical protein
VGRPRDADTARRAKTSGVPIPLPNWVVDDVASVRAEVAEWAGLTDAERLQLAKLCAQDVLWAARASGDPRRILDRVDPLPESTQRALARLRKSANWGNGGH